MAGMTTLVVGGAVTRAAGYGYDMCRRVLEQLRARGSRIVLTDRQPILDLVPELTALADEVHALEFLDTEACVAWALERTGEFDAVVGFREYAVQSAAACAHVLGLPGNPPATVRRVRTKDACREHLRRNGFRQPQTLLCAKPGEADDLLSEFGRVVVKPRDKANSEGVSLVTDHAELPAAFAAAGAGEAPVLVETWVEGAEFSVEGLFVGGEPAILAVTQKHLAPGTFVEVGHTMPAPLPDAVRERVCDDVDSALRVLELRSGLFHVECWVEGDQVTLGEVHARQGGDWLHAMVEWCRPGFELYGSWLDDIMGRPVRIPEMSRAAASRFLLCPAGVVQAVHGWEDLAYADDVLAIECTVKVGDRLTVTGSNVDRRGSVVVGADSVADASATAAAYLGQLHIEVAGE